MQYCSSQARATIERKRNTATQHTHTKTHTYPCHTHEHSSESHHHVQQQCITNISLDISLLAKPCFHSMRITYHCSGSVPLCCVIHIKFRWRFPILHELIIIQTQATKLHAITHAQSTVDKRDL